MLVGFGQTVCKPVRPLCYQCEIAKLCPFEDKTVEGKPNSKKSKVKEEEEV